MPANEKANFAKVASRQCQQALRLSPNDVVGCGQQLCTVSVLDLADWHLPLPRHLPAVRGALHCFVNTSSIVM